MANHFKYLYNMYYKYVLLKIHVFTWRILTPIDCLSSSSWEIRMSFSVINFRFSASSFPLCRVNSLSLPIISELISFNCTCRDSISRFSTFCSSTSKSLCLFKYACRSAISWKTKFAEVVFCITYYDFNLSIITLIVFIDLPFSSSSFFLIICSLISTCFPTRLSSWFWRSPRFAALVLTWLSKASAVL